MNIRGYKVVLLSLLSCPGIAAEQPRVKLEVSAANVLLDGGSIELNVEMDGHARLLVANNSIERSEQGLFPAVMLDGVEVKSSAQLAAIRRGLDGWLKKNRCNDIVQNVHARSDLVMSCMGVEGFTQLMDLARK